MEYKLSELVNLKYGKSQKEVASPHGKYPIMGTGGIIGYASDFLYDKPSVLIGRKGSIQNVFYIDEPFWTIDTLFYTEINESKVIPRYLFYKFKTMDLMNYNEGTTIPSLRTQTLNEISLNVSDLNQQKRIVEILYNYDQKIELNNKIIANLEAQAQAIFKSWFIDFEPFQDGEFVESELGLIPEGWEVKNLGDIVDLLDHKRIPISKLIREKMEKNYPYYSANGIIDYVEDYLFNGKYLLLGEDGTVKTSEGYPILNYVNGKFWVSNHAHILEGKNVSTEFVYLSLKKRNITGIITGAVQEKINQKNLKSLKMIVADRETQSIFEKRIHYMFELNLLLKEKNKTLAQIRDTLLPKLMSGEIDVSNIKIEPEEIGHV